MTGKQLGLLAVVLLGLAVIAGLKVQRKPAAATTKGAASEPLSEAQTGVQPRPEPSAEQKLPQLIDLGSTTCIPCKMMTPILEELERELAGKVQVRFVDIYADPQAADKFGIQVIPTQVFLDAKGQEVFRHEGFMPKEEIVAQLKQMGVKVPAAASEGGG